MKSLRPVLLFLLLLFMAIPGQSADPGPSQQKISVTAKRYSFTPSEITVEKGKPVVLAFTSQDVTHGLSIPKLGIWTEIRKGRPTEVTFTPAQAGVYQGQCAHFCGAKHAEMRFTIRVTE